MSNQNPISFTQSFLTNLIQLYGTTVFATEDSNISAYLNTFSAPTAGGAYTFGALQFNLASGSPGATLLASSGYFTPAQMAQLAQNGGLTVAQLGTLNTALQNFLGTTAGQNGVNNLITTMIQGYETTLQTDLNAASPGIAAAAYSDPVGLQNALDFFNQYGIAYHQQEFQQFLQGQSVQLADGNAVQYNSSMSFGQNVQAFVMAYLLIPGSSPSPGGDLRSPERSQENT